MVPDVPHMTKYVTPFTLTQLSAPFLSDPLSELSPSEVIVGGWWCGGAGPGVVVRVKAVKDCGRGK